MSPLLREYQSIPWNVKDIPGSKALWAESPHRGEGGDHLFADWACWCEEKETVHVHAQQPMQFDGAISATSCPDLKIGLILPQEIGSPADRPFQRCELAVPRIAPPLVGLARSVDRTI